MPLLTGAPARAATFSNTTPITGAEGPAVCGDGRTLPSSYPSNIAVSGQIGTIDEVAITLHGLSGWNNDVDVLLVGPGGQKFVALSDSGSAFIEAGGATVTLTDAAGAALPQTGAWPASPITAKPTDYSAEPDVFPSPAPAGPYDHAGPTGTKTFASVFNGSSPNGTWSLYLTDDCIGDPTSISGGWSLNVTTAAAATTSTTVASSANPSFTGDSVTFTAHVRRASDGTNVTAGTVTFTKGATTLAANVPLDASGRASFATAALAEGSHTITATYDGTPSFATSNGSTTQTIDNHTTRTGNRFCNTGSVAVTTGAATPYPSRIFVADMGALSKVTVSLKNVTHPFPDDMDVLLVGPGGQKLVVVSDAGGGPPSGTAASGVTVTFDDDAASALADSAGGWGASGATTSWRPTDFDEGADAFSPPAPSGPYSHPAPTGSATLSSVFAGANPNGTWQLLVQDDSLSDNGTIAGGWCLDFTTTNDAATTTSVTSSANPSFTGDEVTFTAHVVRTDTSADVTTGSVTFKNGSAALGPPVALDGNGRATITTDDLTEGTHTIGAFYGGSPGSFNLSSGTVAQEVNDRTTGSGTTFCNAGAFPIGDPAGPGETGRATPYPSKIFVPSDAGTVAKVTVTLENVTHPFSDDVDVLLVGPEGDAIVVVSDAGGGSPTGTATSNVTVTFDDSAPGVIADTLGGWGAAGASASSRPADYAGADVFPAPAPGGPYGSPAPGGSATFDSVFGGTEAGGAWRLFVVDDTLGDAGTIANGWCIDLALAPIATDDDYVTARDTTLDVAAPGVLDNDSGQPAPSVVAITGGTTSEGGAYDVDVDGSFTYDPPADFTGQDSFTYTIGNGGSLTDEGTVTIDVRNRPTITAETIARRQGSPALAQQIATVDDAETPKADLDVAASPPAGISVSNVTNDAGSITAEVAASCDVAPGDHVVGLVVTDGDGFTASDGLVVDVDANTPPELAYPDATVAPGGTLSLDPGTGPDDNGSVASLAIESVTPAGFTGDVSVAGPSATVPGRVTIEDAAPPGFYEVTVRATDDCGDTTDASFSVMVGTAPTIAGESIARQQGAAPSGSLIATVDDAETDAGALVVTATPPAGITVANVVNDAGAISADVSAACTATTGAHSVPIEVSDADGFTQTDVLTVDVVANAPPTLSYADASVLAGDSVTIDPETGPSDAGVVAAVALQDVAPASFSGVVAVAGPAGAAPGRVTVSDSGPVGTYELTVRATDGCGETTDASFDLAVVARPDAGGPYEIREGQDLSLESSGAGDANVTWDLDDDGTFSDAVGPSPTVPWSELVDLGLDDGPLVAPIEARFDDVLPGASTSAESTVTIVNAAPTASVDAPAEALVSKPVTVQLGFDDPSPADDASPASYRVEWGDGTSDDVTGGALQTRSHAYSETGVYTVEVSVTDKDGATSEVVSRSLHVAAATIVDVPCGDGGRMVHVVGSSSDDEIEIVGRGSDGVRVLLDGRAQGSFDGVALVQVDGGRGDDVVRTSGMARPIVAFGQGGDDRLVGSPAADVLLGGRGVDGVRGAGGRDLIVGGAGGDALDGGSAQDVVATGRSAWDRPTDASVTAVCKLRLEWTGRAPQRVRIDHLTGALPGGLNGDTLVDFEGAARTVVDDSSRDDATGGAAPDWLLVNRGDPGIRDSFVASGGDLVDDL